MEKQLFIKSSLSKTDNEEAINNLVPFVPIKDGEVSIYVCGPTVYDKAHLGHGRSAVVFDFIRKYLREFKGYNVTFVSNYTDIDDKMIKRAREEKISVKELAEKVIPMYERDYGLLGIEPADKQPRATDHIDDILKLIEKLEDKGYVYVIDGDGVYYDVSKFSEYGMLSNQKIEDLKMGARIDVNNKKRNPYDFALWKFKKEEDEPAWESKWGLGRPGWHIECSAMSWAAFGEKFDIHGGGLDLKFPHHECELAQSCGAFGDGAFAKYWIHNGFITIDNEKMSKSLNNFFTLEEIFEKYEPQVVRLMYLKTHYSNPINFSEELLEDAKGMLKRLQAMPNELEKLECEGDKTSDNYGAELLRKFEKLMDNDFNLAEVFGSIFKSFSDIKALDTRNRSEQQILIFIEAIKKIDRVLGIIYSTKEDKEIVLTDEEKQLLKDRREARRNRDYTIADKIRYEFEQKGYELVDVDDGTTEVKWK